MNTTKLKILKDELKIPVQTIAQEMGVGRQTIYRLLDGQPWSQINEDKLNAYIERICTILSKI